MTYQKLIVLSLLFSSVSALAATGSSVKATAAVKPLPTLPTQSVSNITSMAPMANGITPLLFIQMAGSAVLTEAPGSDDHRFVLKMNKLSSAVTYFADRAGLSNREVGSLSPEQFASCWSKGKYSFAQYPPEGGLVAKSFKIFGSFGVRSDVLKLSNPQYNAMDNSMTYEAEPVQKYHPKLGIYSNVSLYLVKRLGPSEFVHSICK